jgi:hypothetical protein
VIVRRIRPLWAFIALTILGFSALPAAASEATATIRIRIVSPAPLPAAATVEFVAWPFTSTFEISANRRPAIIRVLPAGTYRVTVRLPEHRDATATVSLTPATHSEYEVALRRLDETVDSSLKLVSSEPVGTDRTFDEALIETLPADDALAAIVETTVAPLIVDRMSNGGLWAGEAALIGGQASSWRNTTVALDDLDVTDPARPGVPLLRPSQGSIAALAVSTALLPASAGGPGPLMTLVPKSSSATWSGSVEGSVIAPALQSGRVRVAPPIARFDSHHDGSGHIGGSLAREAGLFVSTRFVATDRIERADVNPLETGVSSVFGSASIAKNGHVRVVGSVDRVGMPYAGRARFRDRDVRETDTFATGQVSWDRSAKTGSLWSISAGIAQGTVTPKLAAVDAVHRVAAAGTVERLLDGPVPTLFDVMPGTRRRITGRAELTPSLGRWGSAQLLQAGVAVSRNTAVTRGQTSPPVAELVDGLPARVWEYEYRVPESRWASTEFAGYVTDRVMIGARGTLDAGVRLDTARGSADGASNGISWMSAEPRLAARWVVARPIAFFGGYARYAHRLPLDYFAYGDPGAATGRVYRWNDLNRDGVLQTGEYGALVAAVGPCCSATAPNRIDPNLRRPTTDEGVAGIETRFGGWSLRIAGVSRRERDLIGSVDVGAGVDAYELRYVADLGEPFRDPPDIRPLPVYDRRPSSFGLDQYLLTNPPETFGTYDGFEVTIGGRIGSRFRTRFDGTSYQGWVMAGNRGFRPLESDPGVIGELFENPNAQTYAYGHGFVDRGYVIKWWAHYAAPKNYAVSAVARYQDGQPFSRLAIIPDLNQGPEAINGYRLGRTRFTFTFSLDTHIEKTFSVGRGKVAAILEVFNLLDTDNEVEEDVTTGSTFRVPTALQPPRAARIGVRVAF